MKPAWRKTRRSLLLGLVGGRGKDREREVGRGRSTKPARGKTKRSLLGGGVEGGERDGERDGRDFWKRRTAQRWIE